MSYPSEVQWSKLYKTKKKKEKREEKKKLICYPQFVYATVQL